MKLRLTRIASKLGYNATPEHAPTHADVFVHEASLRLAIQLNPTQFRKRTAVREAKDAKVCWLIREGLDSSIPPNLTALPHKSAYPAPASRCGH
jgi:hypothetical protein